MSKPTIVLIPGAWHVPAHYHPLSSRLESAGYKVRSLHLPSTAQDPTTPNHDSDVSLVRRTIETAISSGEEVLVVMHSAGGVIGGEAVQALVKPDIEKTGKPGGVIGLVYIAACALPESVSVFGSTSSEGQVAPAWCAAPEGSNSSVPKEVEHYLYNDFTPAQIEEAKGHLLPHSSACMWSPVTYEAWKYIPSTYLICEEDNAIPLAAQEYMVSQEGAKFTVERCTAGHCVMISRPDFTAEVVRRAAGEKI